MLDVFPSNEERGILLRLMALFKEFDFFKVEASVMAIGFCPWLCEVSLVSDGVKQAQFTYLLCLLPSKLSHRLAVELVCVPLVPVDVYDGDLTAYRNFYQTYEEKGRLPLFKLPGDRKVFLFSPGYNRQSRCLTNHVSSYNASHAVLLVRAGVLQEIPWMVFV